MINSSTCNKIKEFLALAIFGVPKPLEHIRFGFKHKEKWLCLEADKLFNNPSEYIPKIFECEKFSCSTVDGNKTDINIAIFDLRSQINSNTGFVKSQLDSDYTSLNASGAPNFDYRIDNSLFNAGLGVNFIFEVKLPSDTTIDIEAFNKETYGTNHGLSSCITRLKNDYGAEFVFYKVQSPCLYQNLRIIDGSMPFLLSQLLLIRFANQTTDVAQCVQILTDSNPLDFDIEHHGEVYEYKVKRFLQDCSLGMVPEKPWTGRYDATGGQIIVKEDGDVLCYHIYELNRYLDYLYNNTKFETASTSEDENNPGHRRPNPKKKFFFGWLYEEKGKLYIKLNLQIRFK